MICSECDLEKETRPYGKGGTDICFNCAVSPENKERTTETFRIQLEVAAIAGNGVVYLTDEGPQPSNHK